MAEISKGINIKYRWYNHELEHIDHEHVKALEETAFDRIGTMMSEGYTSGELNDNIHMHDTDPKDGIEYRGWWGVTTTETEDEKAAQAVKDAAPELLEALIEITGYKYDEKTNMISILMPGKDSALKKAMIAIAKANGEYKL